jgi:galactose oxidase
MPPVPVSINGSTVSTRKVGPMANPRAFHNSVVLPDGKVAVFGGQSYPVPFSDNTAVLGTEIWDPVTETFTPAAAGGGAAYLSQRGAAASRSGMPSS